MNYLYWYVAASYIYMLLRFLNRAIYGATLKGGRANVVLGFAIGFALTVIPAPITTLIVFIIKLGRLIGINKIKDNNDFVKVSNDGSMEFLADGRYEVTTEFGRNKKDIDDE